MKYSTCQTTKWLFCICAIPTDRRYKKSDKAKQFKYIAAELKSVGIKEEGFATDGDETYFSAQKSFIGFGQTVDWNGFTLVASPYTEIGMVQDFIHMLQKIRLRPFDQACDLNFNGIPINSSFLKILLIDPLVSKETFGLTLSDVKNKDKSNDKMNCAVTLKLCDWKVIEGLRMVEGSSGLQQYLKLMTLLHEACILDETKINLKTRLFNLIYVVSFCRRWKQFLMENGGKPNNFLTRNAWTSIEMNLVFFVRLLRQGYGHMIYLCTSQTCEEMFRTIRSFGTWGFTQINFSMSTGLDLLSKVNLMLDVMNKLSKSGMKFGEKFADQSLPSNSKFIPQFLHEFEELEIVTEAFKEAKFDAFGFGMNSDECDISTALKHGDELDTLVSQVVTRNVASVMCPKFKEKIVGDKRTLNFKNLQFIDEPQEKLSDIARLMNPTKIQLISKQQFLRIIDVGSGEKVSNDRIRRFIAPDLVCPYQGTEMVEEVLVNDEISIGDWIAVIDCDNQYTIGMIFKFRVSQKIKGPPSVAKTLSAFVKTLSNSNSLQPTILTLKPSS